jgi:TonB family protein
VQYPMDRVEMTHRLESGVVLLAPRGTIALSNRRHSRRRFSQSRIGLRLSIKSSPNFPAALYLLILVCLLNLQVKAQAQLAGRAVTLAVLDFGDSALGRAAAEKLGANLKHETGILVMDRDQTQAAARGAGYTNSMNLTLSEARDLGAALGCDFFIVGDAQTLRRSPSTNPLYFESYASIFVVSSRTGRLIDWQRPDFRAPSAPAAEQSLIAELSAFDVRNRSVLAIRRAQTDERKERALSINEGDQQTPIIEAAPDDDKRAEAVGIRLPRPYRHLLPAYPETASRAEAEATVDVLVDLDARGEVMHVSVARWAGFGLDEATIDTVRKLHFFPAMRNGVAIPIRVLLRYNFRKPPP